MMYIAASISKPLPEPHDAKQIATTPYAPHPYNKTEMKYMCIKHCMLNI